MYLSKIIKKDDKLITIIFRGYSGSNLSPIIERLKSEKYKNYKIKIIHDGKAYNDFLNGKINKIDLYKARIEKYKCIFRSNLLITTHGCKRLRYDNNTINLWHGIPIKAMSLMNKSNIDKINHIEDDYFISTSDFFNTIMNSCIGITADKYCITGYPRNDYLLNANGIENLNILLDEKINGNIVLYMPTYRYDRENIDNIFGFSEFCIDSFYKFLDNNNIILLLKLHPNEEKTLASKYKKYMGERIRLITSDDLETQEMDLYKIVNAADLLITDYSSIYFDYLLLNKPIIFTPVDLEHYRENRGLLLEPYEYWTPGPKCIGQEQLQNEILKSLDNPEYYQEERENMRNIFHKYQDGSSTDRVMELIEKIMEE
ncbi:MAG TPA: CDP-glycerol--glycerophosphate glycerophosphotransferase [Tepidimicrobium sp.]|nr:CDP-glycerol--glycerophosphate glycerophosphotransferase [Tepidimicrobium sp.]